MKIFVALLQSRARTRNTGIQLCLPVDSVQQPCFRQTHWFACHAEAAIKGLEISPQAMSAAGDLASRVASNGGAALLIDYGRDRPYPASLQAIRQHKFCGLLEQPGMADLSAHVDFGAIRYKPSRVCSICVHHTSEDLHQCMLPSLRFTSRCDSLTATS